MFTDEQEDERDDDVTNDIDGHLDMKRGSLGMGALKHSPASAPPAAGANVRRQLSVGHHLAHVGDGGIPASAMSTR
jgi:hypothetical protein